MTGYLILGALLLISTMVNMALIGRLEKQDEDGKYPVWAVDTDDYSKLVEECYALKAENVALRKLNELLCADFSEVE